MKINQILVLATLALICLVPLSSHATQIRIEFNGVFSECLFSCPEPPLDGLVGQTFSGVVELPDAESAGSPDMVSVTIPYAADRGLYTFNSNAFMSLTTGVPQFDLHREMPVNVIVQRCIELSCPLNEDFVFIYIVGDEFDYGLTLAVPSTPFETATFPSLNVLQGFYLSSMEIVNSEFTQGVHTSLPSININISEVIPQVDDDLLLFLLPAILSNIIRNGSIGD